MESQGTGVEGIGRNRSDLREAKLQPFARVVGVIFRLANDWSAPTNPCRNIIGYEFKGPSADANDCGKNYQSLYHALQ